MNDWQGIVLVLDQVGDLAAAYPDGVPWVGRCAPELAARDGSPAVAQALVVTAAERAQLEALFPGRVIDCTPGGIASASLRFPQFQWYPAAPPADLSQPLPPSLGFIAGFEPT